MEPNQKGVRVSDSCVTLAVDADTYVAWNRYFPDVALIDADTAAALETAKGQDRLSPLLPRPITRQLLAKGLAFEGPVDPSNKMFRTAVDQAIVRVQGGGRAFIEDKEAYSSLAIVNTSCNLTCSYCIQRRALDPHPTLRKPRGLSASERLTRTLLIVDQYVARRISKGLTGGAVYFNGGEILLDWPIVKGVIEHLADEYPHIVIAHELNTNMTRMTPDIMRFLDAHNVLVHPSIDGYGELHDETRRYRNGGKTFQDVLSRIRTFNALASRNPIRAFQGTLERPSRISSTKIRAMSRYGFNAARLGVNLLGTTPEEAIAGAELLTRLYRHSRSAKLVVFDGYFENVGKLFAEGKGRPSAREGRFNFYCNGLSGVPTRNLQFNVSSMQVAQSCPFFPKAFVPLAEVQWDIHHPRIATAATAAFAERLMAVKRNCTECSVVGICRGACVMSGLDSQNQLNAAGCAYQKAMWRLLAVDLARLQMVSYKLRSQGSRTPERAIPRRRQRGT